MGSNSIQILADNDEELLGYKRGKKLFCLLGLSELGKCTRFPPENSAGAQADWEEEEEDSYNPVYVFPHNFAEYTANKHEFKFILSVKWCPEIGIHEPPMFTMPGWCTENSHLSSFIFSLPLTAAWSVWAPQATPGARGRDHLQQLCATADHFTVASGPPYQQNPIALCTGNTSIRFSFQIGGGKETRNIFMTWLSNLKC